MKSMKGDRNKENTPQLKESKGNGNERFLLLIVFNMKGGKAVDKASFTQKKSPNFQEKAQIAQFEGRENRVKK